MGAFAGVQGDQVTTTAETVREAWSETVSAATARDSLTSCCQKRRLKGEGKPSHSAMDHRLIQNASQMAMVPGVKVPLHVDFEHPPPRLRITCPHSAASA